MRVELYFFYNDPDTQFVDSILFIEHCKNVHNIPDECIAFSSSDGGPIVIAVYTSIYIHAHLTAWCAEYSSDKA